jgi:hypothetical protein
MGAADFNDNPSRADPVGALQKRRRRERWSAFLKPLISLTAIVGSIGLLMFVLRTCAPREPQAAQFFIQDDRPSPRHVPADTPAATVPRETAVT